MNLPIVLRRQVADELLAACDYLETQRRGLSIRGETIAVATLPADLVRAVQHDEIAHARPIAS
jgi:hypothetical protein